MLPLNGLMIKSYRFNKLVWGTFGMEKETPSGVLAGGTDSGGVVLWDPVKILNGETDDAVLVQNEKHTGELPHKTILRET